MKIYLPFYSKPVNRILLSMLMILFSFGAGTVYAQPGFSKTFNRDIIGPGSVSTLTFTIDNSESGIPATDLAFSDNLPAEITIATPSNARISDETGMLNAPDGGTTISYSGGRCGGGKTLTISVDVTSATIGTHTNTTGDLTSSLGNSGTATDDLTVASTLPGFSMSFSPDTINYGERTTLTFTIDNSMNSRPIGNLDFTDNLPSGVVIANPANASMSLLGNPYYATTLTALPGSNIIKLDADGSTHIPGFESLGPGVVATVSVDVIGNSAGTLVNVTEELLADYVMCGKASAALEVLTPKEISIRKSFSPNPISAGGTTNIEYTIENRSRSLDATNISFTDDLDAALSGLVATGLTATSCEGTVSGTNVITYSGGSLAAGSSCTISVPLQVPAGTTPGTYTSASGAVTADFGDRTIIGNTATENLFVASVPLISKTFLNNPVAPGGTTTLEFTITNTDPDNALTDISFTDNLTDFLRGGFPHTINKWPDSGSCGGATFGLIYLGIDEQAIQMTGGSLAPGASCTFTIEIAIPTGFPSGIYTNTTSTISGGVGGMSVLGDPASANLEILELPRLSMSFTDDPVMAGGTATLEFTLTYDASASGNATEISFTNDLGAVIPGLIATGLPINDVCGTGSQLSGTSTLSLTGGNMSPGDSSTFSVPVQVPATAIPGSYSTYTSALSATVGGFTSTNNPASDNLDIAGLSFTAEFIDDPVIPGDLATLRYTFDNTTPHDANISFLTDNLNGIVPGLVAEGPLPTSPCGAGASLSGTTSLVYTGGLVGAGTNCSFDVMCRVPADAAPGEYNSTTSSLFATINGSNVIIPPANKRLVVNNNLIELSKTFNDDPVVPGSTVSVEYTLTNLDPTRALSNMSFSDNLPAGIVVADAANASTTCTGGTLTAFPGSNAITYDNAYLAAGASCTVSVTLQTPVDAPFGASISSTTSSITGEINGLPVKGEPATDNLDFTSLQISKAFTSSINAGGLATLTYTLSNPDPSNSVSNIRFTDDLNASITGATANNLPINDVCGAGSAVTGSSVILFKNGSLAANETKTFDVTVQIPCGTVAGNYTSTTSTITADGNFGTYVIDPAAANLTIYNSLPVANCKNITVYLDTDGFVSVDPSDVNDGSTPDCASLDLNFTDFTCENLGKNRVNLTVSDSYGNTDVCQTVITVADKIKPTIETSVESVTLEIEPGECETKINYPELTVSDNCNVTLTKTEGLGADGLFPLGTTTETWLATDTQGNTAEVSFDVTITAPNAPPTIDAINDTVVIEDTDLIIIPLTGIASGNGCENHAIIEVSPDNTELITSTTLNYTQGDTDASINLEFAREMSGESEITVLVTDNRDTISETFKVTVTAVNDAPFVVAPMEDQFVHPSSSLTLPVSQDLGILFDDIDDEMLTFTMTTEGQDTLPSWATFNEGELTFTPMISDTGCVNFVITATDAAEVSASDTFKVCVLDNTVSIDELNAGIIELKIYPNPTKGLVTIEPKTAVLEDIEIVVMNIAGREVYQKTYRSGDPIRFDMSEHVSGIYMVIVSIDSHRIVKKLILDRK